MDFPSAQEPAEFDSPQNRLLELGVHTLGTPELVALLIGKGMDDPDALALYQKLMMRYRNIRSLARCDVRELLSNEGIDFAMASRMAAASEFGRRAARAVLNNRKIDSPEIVCQLLAQDMRALNQESLRVLLLDTKHYLLRIEEISLGSLNESIAHPREIFRPAFLYAAYAMILVHNHPSGDPEPSKADRALTRRIVEIGEMLQIIVADHIIIGGEIRPGKPSYYSFKEARAM